MTNTVTLRAGIVGWRERVATNAAWLAWAHATPVLSGAAPVCLADAIIPPHAPDDDGAPFASPGAVRLRRRCSLTGFLRGRQNRRPTTARNWWRSKSRMLSVPTPPTSRPATWTVQDRLIQPFSMGA